MEGEEEFAEGAEFGGGFGGLIEEGLEAGDFFLLLGDGLGLGFDGGFLMGDGFF